MALLDEHGRAVVHHALCDEAADERPGGAAGRGVLRDADRGVEEPGVRDSGRIDGIQAVQVATLAADLREGRRQPWRIGSRAIDDRAIARGDQQVSRAGRDDLGRRVREHASEYTETLRQYLDCRCDAGETARRLGVHRNTVRYRLGRLVALSGLDLEDADERLVTEFQLRMLA